MKCLLFLFIGALVFGAQPTTSATSAAEAINELKAGNERFQKGKPNHEKEYVARRGKIVSAQSPHTIILSCSDSRVPPEIVFDQTLGSLFVVRVAGNRADGAGVASIEYGLTQLGTKLILVLGHESCGAVDAALSTPADKTAGSPALDQLLSRIRIGVGPHQGEDLHPSVKKNIDAATEELLQQSNIVQSYVKSGDVKIVRAIYSLASGKVEFWPEETKPSAEREAASKAVKKGPLAY